MLKFVAANLRLVSWDPDLHDALDRFVDQLAVTDSIITDSR